MHLILSFMKGIWTTLIEPEKAENKPTYQRPESQSPPEIF